MFILHLGDLRLVASTQSENTLEDAVGIGRWKEKFGQLRVRTDCLTEEVLPRTEVALYDCLCCAKELGILLLVTLDGLPKRI